MATAQGILDGLRSQMDLTDFKKLHWECSFPEYLEIVMKQPTVTRTAYQRLFDMILAHGTEDIYENKDKLTRYKFFTEFATRHGDGIYGLDRPLPEPLENQETLGDDGTQLFEIEALAKDEHPTDHHEVVRTVHPQPRGIHRGDLFAF